MDLTNKKQRIVVLSIVILIFLISIAMILLNHKKEVDLTNSIHGVIIEDNTDFEYKKNKTLPLVKGDRVYILADDVLHQTYTVQFNDMIGTVAKKAVKFFQFDEDEKYSLMCDVSKFNWGTNFISSGDFELFILNNHINYVYIRLGGRGWGQEGNMYYDNVAQNYIDACEYLGVPYGFYYLDEALNDEEIMEEVEFVDKFLKEKKTSMNLLPLTIDLEFQEGKGRRDGIWEERIPILTQLIEAFNQKGIQCMVYANGNRASKYLEDLDSNFWVARYPQDGVIPEQFYSSYVQLLQYKRFLEELVDEEGHLKKNMDSTKEYKEQFSKNFLEKVIGWQFSENGAGKDGIEEELDLSIVRNYFFKEYVK